MRSWDNQRSLPIQLPRRHWPPITLLHTRGDLMDRVWFRMVSWTRMLRGETKTPTCCSIKLATVVPRKSLDPSPLVPNMIPLRPRAERAAAPSCRTLSTRNPCLPQTTTSRNSTRAIFVCLNKVWATQSRNTVPIGCPVPPKISVPWTPVKSSPRYPSRRRLVFKYRRKPYGNGNCKAYVKITKYGRLDRGNAFSTTAGCCTRIGVARNRQ